MKNLVFLLLNALVVTILIISCSSDEEIITSPPPSNIVETPPSNIVETPDLPSNPDPITQTPAEILYTISVEAEGGIVSIEGGNTHENNVNKLSQIDPNNYKIEDLNILIGTYERRPIENGYHEVEIFMKNGKLMWKNADSIVWSLELKDGKLWSGSDSVYGEKELGAYIEDESVFALSFLNENYIRVGDTSVTKVSNGTNITLTAIPEEGYLFVGWLGYDSLESTITITLNSNMSLVAIFEQEVEQYQLTINSSEGGIVSSQGGTYDEGTNVTITATPNEGYIFHKWSNNQFSNEISITINQDEIINAIFLPNTLNGWYSIHWNHNDAYIPLNFLIGEQTDWKLYYFENNILKNMADIRSVSEFWNIDSQEKAIVKKGNNETISSDFFTFENAAFGYSFIEDITHNTNGIFDFTVQRAINSGTYIENSTTYESSKWIAVPFDYDNYPKMEEIRSQSGFYSDNIYGDDKDYSDIYSYIQMFFEDVERYGGITSFTANDVIVNWVNYGGWGATGGGSCGTPVINLDPFWFQDSVANKFYDKHNYGLGVIYHELGHAVFGLDHTCESGHIMTGWHGARDGSQCRGQKDVEDILDLKTISTLEYNSSDDINSWQSSVRKMITMDGQFPYDCITGTGKTRLMWNNCFK